MLPFTYDECRLHCSDYYYYYYYYYNVINILTLLKMNTTVNKMHQFRRGRVERCQ